MWDKTNDPKVTGYQLTVIDQSKETDKTVRFIPARTQAQAMKNYGTSLCNPVTTNQTVAPRLKSHASTSPQSKKSARDLVYLVCLVQGAKETTQTHNRKTGLVSPVSLGLFALPLVHPTRQAKQTT